MGRDLGAGRNCAGRPTAEGCGSTNFIILVLPFLINRAHISRFLL